MSSNAINSYRAAGRSAYTRPSGPAQGADRAQPSSPAREQSAAQEAAKQQQAAKPKAATQAAEGDLSAQEQQMIDQNFPEKPELSMRLYGRSRNAQTVNPGAVGGRLDVQG